MKRLYIYGIGAAACLLSACNSYYYMPTKHHVPLFREAGELRIQGAWSSAEDIGGVEVQISYSLTDELGFMAGYSTFSQSSAEIYNIVAGTDTRIKMIELGAGYYNNLTDHFSVSFFGGIGLGRAYNLSQDQVAARMHMLRPFVQPAIGLRFNALELALSARLGVLSYIHMDIPHNAPDMAELDYIRNHRTSILLEPAATLRLGWKAVKLQLQLGYARNLSAPDLPMPEETANLGIILAINTKRKQQAGRW